MTKYEEVKNALEAVTLFRERKYRSHYLMIMAMRSSGMLDKGQKVASGDVISVTIGSITNPGAFAKLGPEYGSYEREWRAVLKENAHLRGSDYGDGETLEQEKQLDLGYQPGHEQASRDVQRQIKEGQDVLERLMNE